jgi:hypothetical protein
VISRQERPRCPGRVRSTALSRFAAAASAVPLVAVAGLVMVSGPAQAEEPGPKEAFKLADERITESSGLTFGTKHPDTLYTMNDSGGEAEVFAIDQSGETVGTSVLGGAEPEDWEAIASGPEGRLWVGDIGDNERSREAITVYRFHEPETLGDSREQWSRFQLEYDDGPHDAEALLVHPETGRIYIVTKDPEGGGIYAGPEELVSGTETTNTLTRVADAPAVVTDGAFLPDGSEVVLRTYGQVYVLSWPDAKVTREVGLPRQRQGESLAVSPDGAQLFAGSEGANATVFTVSVNGPPPGGAESGSPSPTRKSSPQPEPAEDPAPAGNSSSVRDLLGGLPWWIPALVLAVAALAGFAAFRRPRNRRSPSRTARVPQDAEMAYAGHPDESGRPDPFRYDHGHGPADEPPWAGGDPAAAAPPGRWDSGPGGPWDDGAPEQEPDWSPQPRSQYAAPAAFADQGRGYPESDLPYAGEPPYAGQRGPVEDQGPDVRDPYAPADPASPYADTVRADPYREPADLYHEPTDAVPPFLRNPDRPGGQPAWDDAGWEPASGPTDRPPWADDPARDDAPGRPRGGDPHPADLGAPDLGPAGVGPVGGLRPADVGAGHFDRDSGGRDAYGAEEFGHGDVDRPDLDRPFDRPDFNQPGFDRPSVDQSGFDRREFDQPGFDQPGFDRREFDQPEFDQPGFDQPAFDRPEFDQPGFGTADPPRRDRGAVRQPPPWEPEQPPTLPWRQPSGPPPQRGGRRRADDFDEPGPPEPGPPPGPGDPDLRWPDVQDAGVEMPDVPPRRRSWHDEFESPPRPRRLFRDDDPAD